MCDRVLDSEAFEYKFTSSVRKRTIHCELFWKLVVQKDFKFANKPP